MDLERDGNLIEAGVWFLLALVMLAYPFSQPKPLRPALWWLAVTMAVFGGSDLVEARTDAWWTPWWLLVWKALCVVGLLYGFVRYFKVRKAIGRRETSANSTANL